MSATSGGAGPIGIFDSGVGGLTVLRALVEKLPREDFLYLGDTARLPYGTKSAGTVQRYAVNAARHLVGQGISLLVVACNTASSYALEAVRDACPVPVVGVVEPGVRAVLATGALRVGVIGTEGTIRSESYQRELARRNGGIAIRAAACPLFVPLAEEGWGDHPVTDAVAIHYLAPLLEWGVEAIVLGCTHYPLLVPSLERVVGPGVRLVDSASSVAAAVEADHGGRLAGRGSGQVVVELTDGSDHFRNVARAILGRDPEHLELVDVDAGG